MSEYSPHNYRVRFGRVIHHFVIHPEDGLFQSQMYMMDGFVSSIKGKCLYRHSNFYRRRFQAT